MNKTATDREQLGYGLEMLSTQQVPVVDSDYYDSLLQLLALLSRWNRVYNLTAIREPDQMVSRHLLDSLVMCRWLPPKVIDGSRVATVIDVGTGAGLPVLPLAIVRPDLAFISIESSGKKIRFQQQVILELKIDNVSLINDRVENVDLQADLVLSRAFTAPLEFLHIAKPLCLAGGQVATMLGVAERFPETVSPDYHLEEFCEISVPGIESPRHVAVCRRQ